MSEETGTGTPPESQEPEFTPDPAPATAPSPAAVSEVQQFGQVPKPNSVMLRFGRLGHLSWQSDTSTAVLALIILLVLCILVVVLVLLSLASKQAGWLQPILQIIGNAISAVAGAVVGASAAGLRDEKK